MAKNDIYNCSFCGLPPSESRQIVKGVNAYICSNCIDLCGKMMKPEQAEKPVTKTAADLVVPEPRQIKKYLDQYVVGQDHVKKVLSVAVHNHYMRLKQHTHGALDESLKDVEIEKSNILMIGPTGVGKTLLARTLARMLDVPFAIADATTLTEAGYVGEDVENILLYLLQNAKQDVSRAEMGIIYVDEIDKIGRRTENVSITRDVSGEGVQQALLKILEGTIARVPPQGGRKHPQQEYVKINTEHILFICGGAFVGLDEMMKKRKGKKTIGFGKDDVAKSQHYSEETQVEPEDLIKYGMIPEFVGRLPVVSMLSELSEEEMLDILVKPKNCMVKQYRKLLAMDDVDLKFSDSALKEIVAIAMKRKTGARGLRAVVEKVMLDVMYDATSHKGKSITISREVIRKQKASLIEETESLKIAG